MNRTVLITGCSSGIGYALANAFNENGDKVIATARRVEMLESLKAKGCDVYSLDVTDKGSRQALCEYLQQKHGHIDVLVNNAGMSVMGPMVEIPEEKLKVQFDTNVVAPVLLVQNCLSLLRNSYKPVIINIGSISAVLTTPFAGAYCASQAVFQSVSEAMRLELAPLSVDVVTVQTGAIQSNFGEAAEQGVKEWLTERSLYHSIKDGILARANASQKKATPADQFAAELVKNLEQRKGAIFSIGKGSRLYPLIAQWMPESKRTNMLQKRFGVSRLAN